MFVVLNTDKNLSYKKILLVYDESGMEIVIIQTYY